MLLLTAGLGTYLATGERGLRWSFHLLQYLIPGDLTVEHLDGRLVGPLTISGLRYRNESAEVRIGRIRLEWDPTGLLWDRLEVTSLLLDDSEIRVYSDDTVSDNGTSGIGFDNPLAVVPVEIHLDRFESRDAALHLPGREPLIVEYLSISAVARESAVAIDSLQIRSPLLSADASGMIPYSVDDPLELSVHFDGEFEKRQWRGTADFSGSPARLDAVMSLDRPVSLNGKGELMPFDDSPRWRASLSSKPFSLQTLIPDSRPAEIIAARVEASGRGASIEGSGWVDVRDDEYGRWNAELRGSWNDRGWEISHLLLTAHQDGARINGQAASVAAEGNAVRGYQLELHWNDFAWPLTGPAQVLSPQGSAVLSGSIDDFRYQLDGDLHLPEVPAMHLDFEGVGNRDGVQIERLRGDFLDGRWDGSGTFAWLPSLAWDLRLKPDGIDPSLLRAGLDGRLGGSLRVTGGYDDRLSLMIDIDDLRGSLRQYPLDSRARIEWNNDVLTVGDLTVHSGGLELTGDARFGAEWNIEWQLDASDLAVVMPDLHGTVNSQGTISGPPDALQVDATLAAGDLSYQEHHIDSLEVSVDFGLNPEGQWRASAVSSGTRVAGGDLGEIRIDTSGTTLDHLVHLQIVQQDHRFDQRIHGSLADGRWNALLRQGIAEYPGFGAWSQQTPGRATVSTERIELEDYCWIQDAALLCLYGERQSRMRWRSGVHWEGIDLSRLNPLLAHHGASLSGLTDGSADAVIAAGDVETIEVNIHSGAGSMSYPLPPEGEIHALDFAGAEFAAGADERYGAQATLEVILNESERLNADVSLPGWDPRKPRPAPGDRIMGMLDIELHDLRIITLWMPGLFPGPGGLRASFAIAGTVGSPSVNGDAALEFEHLVLPYLGTRLEAVSLKADIRDNAWTLDGNSLIDKSRLEISGAGEIYDFDDWNGEISLHGTDLEAIRTPTAEITLSPMIALRIAPDELEFNGSLVIPKAKLEPVIKQSTVSVSDDVVVIGERIPDQQPPRRMVVHGSIRLVLGQRVALAAMGFEGRLTGQLQLQLERTGNLIGQGEIQIVDGKYQAYGQNLTINQGRVLYAGGPLDNPAIDIVASRMRDNIEVGVRISGTAERPIIELYSNPAMDDADVLSYLIIGRPMDEAGEGDGRILYSAATSLALVGGDALANRIADDFGLAEVSIEAGDDETGTALVLGKALSNRLYIRYVRGIIQQNNSFQILYELSDKWTVESESGSRGGTGADIFYTLER